MTLIPGTQVKAVFQTVADGSYPHIYYGKGDSGARIASMNAGNSPDLYVGGGGINGAFPAILKPQDWQAYQNLHVALADNVQKGSVKVQPFDHPDPAQCMTICNKPVQGAVDYTGVAFLDAFSDRFCPHGNPVNRAMIYVAPPNGTTPQFSDPQTFLAAVTQVGLHAVEATVAHNAALKPGSDMVVEALRLCMYSSSIYRNSSVSEDDVALAIFAGIEAGLKADATGLTEIQMPVGHTTHYFAAVQKKLTGN